MFPETDLQPFDTDEKNEEEEGRYLEPGKGPRSFRDVDVSYFPRTSIAGTTE